MFADEIDATLGKGRIKVIDIGGGVPLNYKSYELAPTFGQYAALLKKRLPKLMADASRTIITEFGRSVVGKVHVPFTSLLSKP